MAKKTVKNVSLVTKLKTLVNDTLVSLGFVAVPVKVVKKAAVKKTVKVKTPTNPSKRTK